MNKKQLSQWIKQRAAREGFEACAITSAEFLPEDAERLKRWLHAGMHGTMTYMERYFEKRTNPALLVEGARSVIVLLYNYFPSLRIPEENNYIISTYAYGEDYHHVIREKLYTIIEAIKSLAGNIQARPFVDSAPVLERALAVKAGLGWIGKNAHLIVPKKGSFFFIAEIITDLELEYDPPRITDFCGDCRRCIDACPTNAIVAPTVIDARRCISYLTIELREEIPQEFRGMLHNRIFGCDICQDVCPWNRFSTAHSEPRFQPSQELLSMNREKWHQLDKETFSKLFGKSPVKRTGYDGLMRNIRFVNSGDDHDQKND